MNFLIRHILYSIFSEHGLIFMNQLQPASIYRHRGIRAHVRNFVLCSSKSFLLSRLNGLQPMVSLFVAEYFFIESLSREAQKSAVILCNPEASFSSTAQLDITGPLHNPGTRNINILHYSIKMNPQKYVVEEIKYNKI